MIFWFSSSIFSSLGSEVFHQRHDPLRLISFPTGLKCSQWSPGFPPQSLHRVRRFFIKFPFFFSTFLCSAEFVSKRGGNCNNMTLGAGVESSWSGSHITTIIQNFTLVSLASTAMPHPARLPFRATVFSYPTHSATYSTPHCLRSRKVFPVVGTICTLSTCWGNEVIISQASLDGVESERSFGRNRVCSSLVQTSASFNNKGLPSHRY